MVQTVLIFGGAGKTARHITRLLTSSGHTVHSVIRQPAQIEDLKSLGAEPIIQDIEDSTVDSLAETISNVKPNVIIWAACAKVTDSDRIRAIDNEGAIRCMDAAAQAGVKRYIQISAADLRDTSKPEPEWYDDADRKRSAFLWTRLVAFMKEKLVSDRSLVIDNERRGLEYTIVRAGGLTNGPATGKAGLGKVHLNRTISREDVAGVVVECIKNPGTVGLVFDVMGGDATIEEAIEDVVKEKTNVFEGRY